MHFTLINTPGNLLSVGLIARLNITSINIICIGLEHTRFLVSTYQKRDNSFGYNDEGLAGGAGRIFNRCLTEE